MLAVSVGCAHCGGEGGCRLRPADVEPADNVRYFSQNRRHQCVRHSSRQNRHVCQLFDRSDFAALYWSCLQRWSTGWHSPRHAARSREKFACEVTAHAQLVYVLARSISRSRELDPIRFLHSADIHLDSPLRGLAGQQGTAAERIRTATRDAFENLVDLAIDQELSFVVIAGDLYDGDWRAFQTGLFFVSQMGRLNAAGIPVFLAYGNHDAESQITRRLMLPENVKVFPSNKPDTFLLDDLSVALHGQSFGKRDITDNLALAYPEPVSGYFNIGVLHTALGGREGHENYAPCSVADLTNKGYDYWALGHVHAREVVHEHPHVAFSGNLQGRHIRETGSKGALVVTVEDREVANVSPLDVDLVRWMVLEVPLDHARSFHDAVTQVCNALERAVANESNGRMLACRIELSGRTSIHEQLMAAEDELLAEARAGALALGDELAWVEKVVVKTQPQIDPQTLAAREDAIGEMQRLFKEAIVDGDLLQQIEDDVGKMARALPVEVRTAATNSVLKAAVESEFATVIEGVWPYLIARLVAEDH